MPRSRSRSRKNKMDFSKSPLNVLVQSCKKGYIRNPNTNRCIKIDPSNKTFNSTFSNYDIQRITELDNLKTHTFFPMPSERRMEERRPAPLFIPQDDLFDRLSTKIIEYEEPEKPVVGKLPVKESKMDIGKIIELEREQMRRNRIRSQQLANSFAKQQQKIRDFNRNIIKSFDKPELDPEIKKQQVYDMMVQEYLQNTKKENSSNTKRSNPRQRRKRSR